MKKIFLILATAAICHVSNAQKNCKFEVNEFDKFAGKQTKITKKEKIVAEFFTNITIHFAKIGNDCFVRLNWDLQKYESVGNKVFPHR